MRASLFLFGLVTLLSATCALAAPAHTCDVNSITLSDCALNQAFAQGTLYYTASVASSVSSTTLYINQVDPMAIINLSINGGANAQINGDNLPNANIPLSVGSTTLKIEVDCMDCKVVFTIVVTRGGGGVVGDPQFTGLKGQQYQIHGVAGEVYNIISDRSMQMNALFVFLNSGVCPTVDGKKQKVCFSHAGSYLGEIGIQTASGDRVKLVSGPAATGYSSVQVNGEGVSEGQTVVLSGGYTLTRNSTHMVDVQSGVFHLMLENSDRFINQQVEVNDWSAVRAHGLLGQTWAGKVHAGKVKEIEGEVDDYMVTERDLFGSNYVYNRYN